MRNVTQLCGSAITPADRVTVTGRGLKPVSGCPACFMELLWLSGDRSPDWLQATVSAGGGTSVTKKFCEALALRAKQVSKLSKSRDPGSN